MEELKKQIKEYGLLLLIPLIGLITLNWFKGDFIIDTLDFAFPYDRIAYFKRLFTIWNSSNSLGFLDSRIFANLIPYGIYNLVVESLGLSLSTGQKIFVYLTFTGSGLSTYYLTRKLGFDKLAAFLAALFYMMNPFSLTFIWPMRSLFVLSYAFMPLVVGHFISIIKKDKFHVRNPITHTLLIFLLLTSALSNPTILLIYLSAVILYLVLFFLDGKKYKKSLNLFITLALLVLLSSFWLIPFISSYNTEFANAENKIQSNDDITFLLTSSKTALDSFNFTGFWALKSGYKQDSYFPWYDSFETTLGVMISYIPILLLAYLLLSSYKNKNLSVLFLSILALFGLLFITGVKDIFPAYKENLFFNFPTISRALRNLETKFGPILLLAVSPVFGAGVSLLFSKNNSKKRYALKGVFFLMVLLYFSFLMRPFFTGDVIYPGGNIYPSSRVSVPQYYTNARRWLDLQDEEFKIIGLPLSTIYQMAFDWENGFAGTNPDRYLLGRSVLTNNTGGNYAVPQSIAENSNKDLRSFYKARRIAGLYNIKYILLHHDAHWKFIEGNKFWIQTNNEKLGEIREHNQHIGFGDLTFIETKNKELNSQIYIPKNIAFYNTNAKLAVDTFVSEEFYKPDTALITSSSAAQLGIEPSISFQFLWGEETINSPKKDISIDNETLFYQDTIQEIEVFSRLSGNRENQLKILRQTPEIKIEGTQIKRKEIEEKIINLNPSTTHVLLNSAIIPLNESASWVRVEKISIFEAKVSIAELRRGENDIIDNGGFELGTWQLKAKNCSAGLPGKPLIGQGLSQDSSRGQFSLRLESGNHIACVNKELKVSNDTDFIHITFDYKNLDDSVSEFCIWNSSINKCKPSSKLVKTNSWKTHDVLINNAQENGELLIYLYTPPSGTNKKSINLYDNIQASGYKIQNNHEVILEDKDWIILEENYYLKKNQSSSLFDLDGPSLVKNGSFDAGLWGEGVRDCSAGKEGEPGISMNLINNTLKGNFLELNSSNHLACTSNPLIEYSKNKDYLVEVEFKNIGGDDPKICLWESGINECLVFEKLTNSNSEDIGNGWRKWKKTLRSSIESNGASIFLYTEALGETKSINYFDNIKIQKLPINLENTIVIHSENDQTKPGSIQFKKINPTLYKTEAWIPESNLLIFNESYDPRWQAFVESKDGKNLSWWQVLLMKKHGHKIDDVNHVIANGFVNGWWIDPSEFPEDVYNEEGEYEIIIEFWPQRYFYVGLVISGTTLLGCIGYLLYDWRRRKRK